MSTENIGKWSKSVCDSERLMTYKCQHSIKKLSQSLRIRAICGTWPTPGDVTARRVHPTSSTSLSFFLCINPHSSIHILSFIFHFPSFGRTMKTSPLFLEGGLEFGDSFMKHLRFKKAKEASPAAIRPHQDTDTVFTKRLLSPCALHWAVSFGFEHSCSSISQEHLAFARRAIN